MRYGGDDIGWFGIDVIRSNKGLGGYSLSVDVLVGLFCLNIIILGVIRTGRGLGG